MSFILLCAALSGAACARIWNAVNRAGLRSDMAELLAKSGLPKRPLECRMVATTNDAFCTFSAEPGEAARLASELSLQPHFLGTPPGTSGGYFKSPANHRCRLALRAVGGGRVEVFGRAGRPKELRLRNGRAFEYLLLFQDPSAPEVCIEVSYSYG